jgi:hypothetical protein
MRKSREWCADGRIDNDGASDRVASGCILEDAAMYMQHQTSL